MTCPNENTEDYKKLESFTDKPTAYYYWNKFKGFEGEYSVDNLIEHLSTKYSGYRIQVIEDLGNKFASTDGKVVKLNGKLINNLEAFYTYIEGKTDSPTSEQKKYVLKYLEKNHNITLEDFKSIVNTEEKLIDFLIFHEISHIENKDIENYFKLDKDKNNPNLLTIDKIEIEARATLDSLNKIRTDIIDITLRDKTVNNIKIFIQKQINKVEKDTAYNQEQKVKKLKRLDNLQSIFEAGNEAEKLKIFVDFYYENIIGDNKDGFYYKIDSVLEDIENTKGIEEQRSLLNKLTYYYDYVESLDSIFSDIDKDLSKIKYDEVKNSQSGSVLNKIDKISRAKDRIKSVVNEVIPELLASQMLPYVSTEAQKEISIRYISSLREAEKIKDEKKKEVEINKINEKYKDLKRDKDSLVEQFKSFKDQRIEEFWTSPTISSSDPLLSLFAKFVKDKFEQLRLSLFKFEKEAGKAFEKFKNYKKSYIDNPAKFNEDLYELITVKKYITRKENGIDVIDEKTGLPIRELKIEKYYSFVDKFDWNKFNEAESSMLASYHNLLLTDSKKAKRLMFEWYRDNKEQLPDNELNKIIEDNRKQLSKEDFQEWFSSNTTTDENGDTVYIKELGQPKLDKYSNSKYEKIKNNKSLNEYYNFLVDNYLNAQNRLPLSERLGLQLPNIPKSMYEKLLDKGVISSLKEYKNRTFSKHELDYDTYNVKDENTALPIYYTKTIPFEEVSLDLIESIMKFEKMSSKFQTVSNIKAETKAASITARKRDIEVVDSKGRKILSKTAKSLGIDKHLSKDDISNTEKWLEAFIDMQIYNKMKVEEDVLGVRLDKVGDFLMSSTSFTSVGTFDYLKALSNNLQANIQIAIESWSGEFLNYKNLTNGRLFYAKNIPQMTSDIGNPINKSLINQMIEVFDPLQGEWLDQMGNKVSGSTFLRNFNLGMGYTLQHAGEHQAQVSMMFGLMDTIELDYNGQKIKLNEAFEIDENGLIKLKEGIDEEWNPFKQDSSGNIVGGQKFKDFVNRTHAINKRLHGIYNNFDKSSVERYTAGRLLMFFRKFVIPGYKRRFKQLGVDEELGYSTEGYYRTLTNVFVSQRESLIKYLLNNESDLTESQKKNIKRAIIDLTFVAILGIFTSLLAAYADDDDDSIAYNILEYEISRLYSETSFFINPNETFRVLKTPTVAYTKLEQFTRLASQVGIPKPYDFENQEFVIFEVYDRNTTSSKKGDNKAFKYFKKFIGLDLSRYSPEVALENFEKASLIK